MLSIFIESPFFNNTQTSIKCNYLQIRLDCLNLDSNLFTSGSIF